MYECLYVQRRTCMYTQAHAYITHRHRYARAFAFDWYVCLCIRGKGKIRKAKSKEEFTREHRLEVQKRIADNVSYLCIMYLYTC